MKSIQTSKTVNIFSINRIRLASYLIKNCRILGLFQTKTLTWQNRLASMAYLAIVSSVFCMHTSKYILFYFQKWSNLRKRCGMCCIERKFKFPVFPIFIYLVMVIFVLKSHQFSMNLHDNSKNKILGQGKKSSAHL